MTEKPKLGFWQIWNMSFGFLGIHEKLELAVRVHTHEPIKKHGVRHFLSVSA